MVACKYFLGGYCKFGLRCKFEHVDPYGSYGSPRTPEYSSQDRQQGLSILKASAIPNTPYVAQEYDHVFTQTPQQSSFGQKPSGLKYNMQEMMHVITKDILQLEKGGQWQLSCYSPLKDLPNIPGLDDHSPEELRWECYKALQNGSMPLCQAIVQQLYANVAKINNDLKRKDAGYAIIDGWLRDSEQKAMQNAALQQPIVASPFGGSSVTPGSTPFFRSDTQPPSGNSFTFTLPQQQKVSQAQPFSQPGQSSGPLFSSPQSSLPSHSFQALSSPNSLPIVDDHAYSAVEELSEAELKVFQADMFVMGAIPTKPPPKILCNL